MLKLSKKWILFIILFIIAVFFRFYNFKEFQYFGGDEEVLTATIRHIIRDKSPSLLVQNATLGFGLGPFYHYFLAIFYWLTNFNLVFVYLIGPILGLVTALLIYFSAKELNGPKTGLIAAFLWSSSFFISLFERRLFHLSLNPFLTSLTILSILKLIKGDKRFLVLLSLPIGFSFHEDASLAVLLVGILISIIVFKVKILNKYSFYSLIVFFLFLSPLVLAQIRYQGAVSKAILHTISQYLHKGVNLTTSPHPYKFVDFVQVLARTLMAAPTKSAEEYFFYLSKHTPALFGMTAELVVVVILVINFLFLFKKKFRDLGVLWIFSFVFALAIFAYNNIIGAFPVQHYFTIFFPIFILFSANFLAIVYDYSKIIFYILIVSYFTLNSSSLLNSRVRFPLYRKIELIKQSCNQLPGSFSIETSDDPYAYSGGWTELYTLYCRPAVKSYWYHYWYWIYAAYSLFPLKPEDKNPETLVYIRLSKDPIISKNIKHAFNYEDLRLEIIRANKEL